MSYPPGCTQDHHDEAFGYDQGEPPYLTPNERRKKRQERKTMRTHGMLMIKNLTSESVHWNGRDEDIGEPGDSVILDTALGGVNVFIDHGDIELLAKRLLELRDQRDLIIAHKDDGR